MASVTARKARGGRREKSKSQQVDKSTGKAKTKPRLLDSGEVIGVVDEIDFIESVMATLPMLRVLAWKIDQCRPRNGPKEENRDPIVDMGVRLTGLDVDGDEHATEIHPLDSSMMSDVAMSIDAVVEAVRWRLQRLSLVLMSAVENQQVNKSTSQQ
jgi:hypothetical protein